MFLKLIKKRDSLWSYLFCNVPKTRTDADYLHRKVIAIQHLQGYHNAKRCAIEIFLGRCEHLWFERKRDKIDAKVYCEVMDVGEQFDIMDSEEETEDEEIDLPLPGAHHNAVREETPSLSALGGQQAMEEDVGGTIAIKALRDTGAGKKIDSAAAGGGGESVADKEGHIRMQNTKGDEFADRASSTPQPTLRPSEGISGVGARSETTPTAGGEVVAHVHGDNGKDEKIEEDQGQKASDEEGSKFQAHEGVKAVTGNVDSHSKESHTTIITAQAQGIDGATREQSAHEKEGGKRPVHMECTGPGTQIVSESTMGERKVDLEGVSAVEHEKVPSTANRERGKENEKEEEADRSRSVINLVDQSAQKVSQLRELCTKHGIKSAKKNEMIMELVKKQTDLAYEGFFTPLTKKTTSLRIGQETEMDTKTTPRVAKSTITTRGKAELTEAPKTILRSAPASESGQKSEPVREWATQFAGLVLTPVDRNSGDTAVVCPVLYRHAYGCMFTWNSDYETVVSSEPDVLAMCKKDYLKTRLAAVGTWKIEGKLGKAYIIPKDKDLLRWRPIAPACSDPAMVGQRRCARALYCLITRYDSSLNFHLNSTQKFKEEATTAGELLGRQGCTMTMGRCYDIKEMFSSIPHTAVTNVVYELLRVFDNQGYAQIRVATKGKYCVMAKTKRSEPGYTNVKLAHISKMVDYDLSHAYMVCGKVIKRQVVRIPMGKTLSPVLATVTCAMAESKFLRSLGTDRRLVKGWRMIDDVSLVVGCTDTGSSLDKSQEILLKFEAAYDSRLKLVRKDENENSWPFIGGKMHLISEPVQIHFVQDTKNTDSL
ncbi:hypothetical protein CBR_g45201 [Chara braunii]|uniref:Reverse transcriptase domain-containing protein n=1 Tax=Chara braunii TaxID=69332 RepID=A0A388K394_CHABU|nr:hypothetical protein CBR_g45201 [Chara braunii]|eukprot:GBG64505.1 hypothetical protein CBR_g45201 [Chara braunii]